MEIDTTLGVLFDQVADLYDKARPVYPEELFDELIKQVGLTENAQILEIAPGTGQATLPLARRGYKIVGVELGRRLSEVAKKKLLLYPNAQINNKSFEDVDLRERSFDLLYAATALHWIKQEERFSKPHRLLKDDGFMAIIGGAHISDGVGDKLFHATQPIYREYWASEKDGYHLKDLNEVKPMTFDERLFRFVEFKCFPRTISYTANAYCELLNTESEKLALPAEQREEFLEKIKKLIDKQFDGVAERKFANSLLILKKRN